MVRRCVVPVALLALVACKDNSNANPDNAAAPSASASAAAAPTPKHDGIPRAMFNELAVRNNVPLYWESDKNGDGSIDPDEIASLLFYPSDGKWVENGKFAAAFEEAYARVYKDSRTAADSDNRKRLVLQDLAQGAPVLVRTELKSASTADKELVRHMLATAKLVDDLYATQNGLPALKAKLPADDIASQSLFRRNWGPKCVAPKTESNAECTAIPGVTKKTVDVYPAKLQDDPKFCDALEKRPDAKQLLEHFTVVQEQPDGKLTAVPYSVAYKDKMSQIATELRAAAAAVTDSSEALLKAYLEAAATSFTTNDWLPADEAWAKMNAQNSKWYLRIAADEDYWEPCSHKAGFHMTFAKINGDSLKWQSKLTPVQQEMEKTLAAHIGAPYAERKVSFHLPDFIDIVWNAGDDRNPFGATIGQSLPNWGKVANEGRGRTVAMSNLYQDADSIANRRKQAESMLTKESLASYSDDHTPGLLDTILHEATHNLGPAHEYQFKGKTDVQLFGGGLASMMEELKAETGSLYFTDLLKQKGIIDEKLANQIYVDIVTWAFGHISRGMYEAGGQRRPYSQLAAIQIGFLRDEGALTWDDNATAANGSDKGAYTVHVEKFPAAAAKLMKMVGQMKASGDRASAEALAKKYVDADAVVPHKLIAERYLRNPKASFVYAVDL
jgi:hypothetical protein